MAKKKSGRPIGRPTKYKAEYCDLLVKHMKDGFSFESFGAHPVCVHKDTLYEWVKKHDEFADAKKRAEIECLKFWERIGIRGATGKIANFNAASFIFNMKNRFKWTDRQEQSIDESANEIKISYNPQA